MEGKRDAARHDVVGLVGLVAAVVALVVVGLAQGVWVSNLHNGLLAVAFSAVGAYVAIECPGHTLGRLCLATGVVEAVVFLGRQMGHAASDATWWAWLGVWPVAIVLALTTFSVICFPDGRLPAPRWRVAAFGIGLAASLLALASAVWPVEYDAAHLDTAHPITTDAPAAIESLWSAMAHPTYALMQMLWIVALVTRWRRSTGVVRVQLAIVAGAAALSVVALLVGLAVAGSPRAGLLAASLTPVAAGWAIVHGRNLAAYGALSWLSRAGVAPKDLPATFVEAVADATDATTAVLWVGDTELRPLAVWPETDDPAPATATSADEVRRIASASRTVTCGDEPIGALSVTLATGASMSRTQLRLLDDLAAQGRFVIEHIGVADLAEDARRHGRLGDLTPREHEVLELMAEGLSNAAICDRLHLSIKTVEPAISSIFSKLGLATDSARNRRVLAVLAFLRAEPSSDALAAPSAPH